LFSSRWQSQIRTDWPHTCFRALKQWFHHVRFRVSECFIAVRYTSNILFDCCIKHAATCIYVTKKLFKDFICYFVLWGFLLLSFSIQIAPAMSMDKKIYFQPTDTFWNMCIYIEATELINISLLMGDVLSVHISQCFGNYVEFVILQNVFNHVLRWLKTCWQISS